MANQSEEIIIIEDDETSKFEHEELEEINENEELKKRKILIFGAVGVSVALIILIATLLFVKSKQKVKTKPLDLITEKLDQNRTKPIEPSKLENMIAKANYLYSTGSKDKALFLYKQIAIYSEAISRYNLGVAQLKDKQYELARQTFQQAIQNDEKRCVSALNAAVCSIHLKDKESFKYYIDLAYAYLPYEINSPLYSYYYTLIQYYHKNYLSALSALKNATSQEYPQRQKHLMAKISALFGNDLDAIEAMEENFDYDDDFSIALLYSRIGDYTLAIKHFEESITKNIEPAKSQLAMGLVKLKSGRVQEAAKDIKNVTDMFPDEVYKSFPIKVKLRDALFDTKKAQKLYRENAADSKSLTYQKIFYFAPYKLFNANQTIDYIRKGNANIFVGNINSAKGYLSKGTSSSNVNIGISEAIKDALDFNLRDANHILQKLVKIQPRHSILQYNLGLTYAQMGDMQNAYIHFIRSYHLDAKNYLSGIFAIMTSQLISKDFSKLKSILKDALSDEEKNEKITLYDTLLFMVENNYVSAVDWLDNRYKPQPLYLALTTMISLKLNKIESAKKAAKKLQLLLPNEIVPNMLYIDAYFNTLDTDTYASNVLTYLKKQKLHLKDLYYGPFISRYLYIQQNLITGKLYYLIQQLKKVLETTPNNVEDIVSGLALASLYDKAYEESYTYYNQLIDDLKVRDAHTLFLGAVASTAANHHANAIALLELAKMKQSSFYESRFALGLLYLELKNNSAAIIQFSKIKKGSFLSQYFAFEIDTDKLLFQKQHQEK